ncbi:MAG: SMC-Scp complex subunit ScpB [bacterium]
MSKKQPEKPVELTRDSMSETESEQIEPNGTEMDGDEPDMDNTVDPDPAEEPFTDENRGAEVIAEESDETVQESEPEQDFEELDLGRLLPMLEALLFAAEESLNAKEVHESIPDVVTKNVPLLIQSLDEWYAENERALTVQRVAGGWRLATRPEFADVIRRHLRGKIKGRLSRASLETMSIIAYRQPVSRPEVDQMRGVDSSPVIRNLLERELIRVAGRAEAPGRPILYTTTEKFLEYFGLDDLASLPKPEEIFGELEEGESGTANHLRSGPFKGAGEGVEEETYRTDDMVHRDGIHQEEPDEEEAPVMQQESRADETVEPEPDEEEAPSGTPDANPEKDDKE